MAKLKNEAVSQFGVSIITPALNEEKNIQASIENILKVFDSFNIDGEIIVINDGSTDQTEEIVLDLMKSDNRIRLLKNKTPKGIGAAFWNGVDIAKKDSVCLLPGDNENYPYEILRYSVLLDHVDLVIPFLFNKEVRSSFRNILSWVYRVIINTTFTTNLNYTNGTVLYRKSILKDVDYRSLGFFFQADILIRLIKRGYLFAEVPYRLNQIQVSASKAVSFPSFFQVAKGYIRLARDQFFLKKKSGIMKESLTAKRQDL